MSTEQIVQFVVGAGIAVYRDEVKGLINAGCRSFWKARTEDMKILGRRNLGPYGEKNQHPDPLLRETVKTIVALSVCLLFSYIFDRFSDKQQLLSTVMSWIVRTLTTAAIVRFFLIQFLFTGYRATLLWVRLSGQAQHLQKTWKSALGPSS